MPSKSKPQGAAFAGTRLIARGPLLEVARAAKEASDHGARGRIRLFEDATGRRVDLDLRGSADDVVARLAAIRPDVAGREVGADAAPTTKGPGRPRLGVVSKEVTLLPRHWAWLGAQRGGASATLRRLVDDARKRYEGRDRVRRAQDSAYRFMSAMAGNEAGFEEAARALYAGDQARFDEESESWPPDVREHARRLAADAFRTSRPRTRDSRGS